LFSFRLVIQEGVTAFVFVDTWILFYVLIPSFLGVCGLFSCVFDRPKVSFVSRDMCCISREFIVFCFVYLLCSLYLVPNNRPVWPIYILFQFHVLACRCLRLRVFHLVGFVIIRVCITAGFENEVYLVLALLHLPVDVQVASFCCCVLFLSLSFHMLAIVSVSVLILLLCCCCCVVILRRAQCCA
jgi:hypothetical protein